MMWLISNFYLSILVACIVVLLVVLLRRRLDYFESRGLPYVKPTWMSILKSFTLSYMLNKPREVYLEERGGDNSIIGFFHTYLMPIFIVLGRDMTQEVLIKDFSHFHDHGFEFDDEHDPLAKHLFNMKGDKWRTLRHKLLPTFTSGKLKGMIPTMENCAKIVVNDFKQDESMITDINLKDLFKSYTLAVIASCGFGIDPKSVMDPNCDFRVITNKVSPTSFIAQMKLLMLSLFPKISKFLGFKFVSHEVDEFFLTLTRDALKLRKTSGVKRNDFIQLLLELKEKGSVELDHRDLEEDEKDRIKEAMDLGPTNTILEMTDELLAAQAFILIAGGFENTSYLVAITLYLLGKHKDTQERVRNEVKAAKVKHNGINYQSLKDMVLLDASISEALRMFPAQPGLFRVCTKTYTLSTGQKIEKGMGVLIPALELQNDIRYWSSPGKFNPDRFITDEIMPGTYLPFGDGPRICIAQRLALLTGKVVLAEVLGDFEIIPSAKTREPLKIRPIIGGDIDGGMWATLKHIQT